MAATKSRPPFDVNAPFADFHMTKLKIDEIFLLQTSNLDLSNCFLYGEVLCKKSENEYMIADSTGYCNVRVEDTSRSNLIKEDFVLRIVNPKICQKDSTIILTKESSFKSSMKAMFEVKVKYCKGCGEFKKPNALLRHISHAKKCKEVYGEEKLKNMIEHNRVEITQKNYQKHKEDYNAKRSAKLRAERQKRRNEKSDENAPKRVGKTSSTTSKANKVVEVKDDDRYCPFCINTKFVNKNFLEKHINSEHMHNCNGCGETFPENSFFKHVSHTPTCKNEYGDDWGEMLKKKRNHVVKKYEIKRKPTLKKYHDSKREKYKAYYQENKDQIRAKQKKSRQDAKDLEKAEKIRRPRTIFEKWLKEREDKVREEIAEIEQSLIRPIIGAYLYLERINSTIEVPNQQIEEIATNLHMDFEVGMELKKELVQAFDKVTEEIHNTPGFGLLVYDDEEDKSELRRKFDHFTSDIEEEWSTFERIVQTRFTELSSIIGKDYKSFKDEFTKYYGLAAPEVDEDLEKEFEKEDFLICCENAFMKAL